SARRPRSALPQYGNKREEHHSYEDQRSEDEHDPPQIADRSRFVAARIENGLRTLIATRKKEAPTDQDMLQQRPHSISRGKVCAANTKSTTRSSSSCGM